MDIFVKRPVIAIVISLALLLAGISAALSIPVLSSQSSRARTSSFDDLSGRLG